MYASLLLKTQLTFQQKTTKTIAKKPAASTKRKATEASEDEPITKKAKPAASTKKAKPTASTKRKATEASDDEPATKKAKPAAKKTVSNQLSRLENMLIHQQATIKKAAAPRKVKALPKHKFGPAINEIPTVKLDVYVCGEGGAGELGLGSLKFEGRKPIDVKRPRINHLLTAKSIGVVSIAVGGMHTAVLTHDNKILTWGVNDNGALGRKTTNDGKMKDISKADGDDSDSDSDDDDSGLNPSESEPREVDPKHFPEGTKFTSLVASDSATFAVTQEGLVYGWGTFRVSIIGFTPSFMANTTQGNDGLLGFRGDQDTQETPILIPELKQITTLAAGTNHVLALTKKGKVFAWGAGEQNQLARRVVQRTSAGALIPREFGLKGETVHIGCGDYHSFAVNKDGTVRSWGLNSWGECGIPKDEDDNDIVNVPTVIESLKEYSLKQVDGGGHHTIAVTESGQVLTWGRIDLSQGGMEPSQFPKDAVFFDDDDKPRYLAKPAVIPSKFSDVSTTTISNIHF